MGCICSMGSKSDGVLLLVSFHKKKQIEERIVKKQNKTGNLTFF